MAGTAPPRIPPCPGMDLSLSSAPNDSCNVLYGSVRRCGLKGVRQQAVVASAGKDTLVKLCATRPARRAALACSTLATWRSPRVSFKCLLGGLPGKREMQGRRPLHIGAPVLGSAGPACIKHALLRTAPVRPGTQAAARPRAVSRADPAGAARRTAGCTMCARSASWPQAVARLCA